MRNSDSGLKYEGVQPYCIISIRCLSISTTKCMICNMFVQSTLDLSKNPITDVGIKELSTELGKSLSIKTVL